MGKLSLVLGEQDSKIENKGDRKRLTVTVRTGEW